mmetsp:Transcript_10060/g.16205  ORF Transcript_10060/g.16205 Transcript_10060/m.16205 type:complete len:90 (-) Transcript_10060:989-1258(-)
MPRCRACDREETEAKDLDCGVVDPYISPKSQSVAVRWLSSPLSQRHQERETSSSTIAMWPGFTLTSDSSFPNSSVLFALHKVSAVTPFP